MAAWNFDIFYLGRVRERARNKSKWPNICRIDVGEGERCWPSSSGRWSDVLQGKSGERGLLRWRGFSVFGVEELRRCSLMR